MGFISCEWVNPFVKGKTVESLEEDEIGRTWLRFTDGTALTLYVRIHEPKRPTPTHEVIATPLGDDGEVLQSDGEGGLHKASSNVP